MEDEHVYCWVLEELNWTELLAIIRQRPKNILCRPKVKYHLKQYYYLDFFFAQKSIICMENPMKFCVNETKENIQMEIFPNKNRKTK